MTREDAIDRAKQIRKLEPGDQIMGATRRWVEIAKDPSQPGPIRDVLCWVVELSGDYGPIADLYIADENGDLVKSESYG